MEAALLWDLAHLFDGLAFQTLATRLTLKTKDVSGLSVGSARGVVVYNGSEFEAGQEIVDLTQRWLGVSPSRGEHGINEGPERV